MNILIGDHRITSDSYNIILQRRTTAKKDTVHLKVGDEVLSDPRYVSTLEDACNSLLERKIKESDAQTIAELRQLLITCTGAICEAVKLYGSSDGN